MKNDRRKRNRNPKKRQEGSALLVSLMVMVGLSLLGLGFVAISETESIIAVNERNFVQAQVAAEAGARSVIEMFQDAPWALTRGLLPPNNVAIKTQRDLGGGTLDYYKDRAGLLLFDAPFRVNNRDRFYGDEEHADVMINSTKGNVATTYLTTLNTALFPDNSVRITDIRVYAPPMPGAKVNAAGFYTVDNTTRFGVATVRVTAEKLVGTRVAATRTVKVVIAETPFPIVDGAIETSGSLVGQGNFHVYWGKVLSEKEMQLARPAVGMPWFDAKEQMNFEYGYDSTNEWKKSTGYAAGDVVNAPNSTIVSDPRLAKFAYVAQGAGTSNATTEPAWGLSVGATFTDNGITWQTVAARQFRIDPSDWYSQYNWLYSLLGVAIEDPWLHARSRGEVSLGNSKNTPCNSANPHPCDFDQITWDPATRYSNVFQKQTVTDTSPKPESLEVFFPTMDFEFWKAIAQGSNNEPGQGIYYFSYAGSNNFVGPGGATKSVLDWMNAKKNGLGAGFYFFDTANGKNPQFGKGGTLTDAIKLNAGAGGPYQMQGYIYLNAKAFGTTGSGNLVSDDLYAMPGEPFRDTGYREVNPVTKKFKITPTGNSLPDGDFVVYGRGNGVWDSQDVNDNGVFDVHVALNKTALTQPDGTVFAAGTIWLPVPWTENCTPPDETKGTAGDCSEPHEPYLNFTYPDVNNPKGSLLVQWADPTNVTVRRPKVKQGENVPITCKTTSPARDCTSNAYDDGGALVRLAPLLWGAMYNEGGYEGSGNATYYGALLMRGNFDSTGTPDVFFNECLAKGCLENQLKLQRVMVTSFETDQ